jgi:hypothetical protein
MQEPGESTVGYPPLSQVQRRDDGDEQRDDRHHVNELACMTKRQPVTTDLAERPATVRRQADRHDRCKSERELDQDLLHPYGLPAGAAIYS